VLEADYTHPDTLDKALSGVDMPMFISGSEIGQRVAQHRNIIDAAKKNYRMAGPSSPRIALFLHSGNIWWQ
jgi:uncharacterized protein YbjT (DUF2867 family)